MASVDRVRIYLSSVYPTRRDHDGDDGENNDDADDDDEDDDDKDHDHNDDDFDSDGSDDSIMMPSFSDIPSAERNSGPAVPEAGAFGIARELPPLFGRGVSSPVTFPPPGFAHDLQRRKPAPEAVAAAAPDPRLCLSVAAPTTTAGQFYCRCFWAFCICRILSEFDSANLNLILIL